MKQRIRTQTKTQLRTFVKKCVTEDESKAEALITEIEELASKKHPSLDQQYRAKISDVCRNLDALSKHQDLVPNFIQDGKVQKLL